MGGIRIGPPPFYDTIVNNTYILYLVTIPCSFLGFIFVVLILTHRYNAVRGHRTGSNNSGVESYLRRRTTKQGR